MIEAILCHPERSDRKGCHPERSEGSPQVGACCNVPLLEPDSKEFQGYEMNIKKIADALTSGTSYLLVTHFHPDGDAIGAILALQAVLKGMGKKAISFCESGVPPTFRFLEGAQEVLSDLEHISQLDAVTLIFLDCGSIDRCGKSLTKLLDVASSIINIDHHVQEKPFGDIFWVKSSASSTCEMLFDLFCFMNVPFTPVIATCLYTGILTDTGSFQFSNTSRRVLEIATSLADFGADPHRIAQQVFESSSPQKLLLLGKVLDTLRYHRDYSIATARLTKKMITETGATIHDGEGFVNMLRQVATVQVAVLFREEENGLIHVGLRSKGTIDVAKFARKFGGGGHVNASACRVKGSIEDVEVAIVSSLEKYLSDMERGDGKR